MGLQRKSRLSGFSHAAELAEWAELVLPWLSPPDLAAAAATCTALHRAASTVTARRVADAARGLERHPIPFLSPADSHPYSYFLYSRSPLLSNPAAQPWGGDPVRPVPDPSSSSPLPDAASLALGSVSGCACVCCSRDRCPCWGRGPELARECGTACGCGLECGNRSTQRGVAVRLKIVRDSKKGWGLHAAQLVRQGEFVCEYAGEFVTTEEAQRRQRLYDELASSGRLSPALLVVREHLPSGKACLRVNIDATKVGNIARFINHSCDGGNLSTVLVRNSGSLLPRLCFFAAKDIPEGEELTFSYGEARLKQKGLPCYCGKAVCLGTLPSEQT